MLYLSGSVPPRLLQLGHPRIGAMFQPRSYGFGRVDQWPVFAADCGGYGGKFDPDVWLPWLDGIAARSDRCLFAVVPDRFDPDDIAGNFAATQEMWGRWHLEVAGRGLVPAWVAQNGSTPDDIPAEAGAVFIGGDTHWKLSEWPRAIVMAARSRGLWAHMGRVNTRVRLHAAHRASVDSVDGTLLKYGLDANLPLLVRFLEGTEEPPVPRHLEAC